MPAAGVEITPLSTLNTCSEDEFHASLSVLFEHAPILMGHLFRDRPYASWDSMLAHARELLACAEEAEQVIILGAHPKIGAPKNTLSALSRAEQSHGGPSTSPETLARLRELNEAYDAKFGFTFMIFVNGRPRHALLPEFEQRLQNTRAEEIRLGLDALIAVARDRLASLTKSGLDVEEEVSLPSEPKL